MRGVAGPRAEGRIEPGESQNSKEGSDHLVKKLAERAPEAMKTALLLRRGSGAGDRGHTGILTQNGAARRREGLAFPRGEVRKT